MKIFSAKQLQEADRFSIEKQGVTSTDLMERAATLVFDEIHKRLEGAEIPVKIFCGIGNNGGDGLVIGRKLIEQGYDVTIYVVNYSDQRSADFLINYDRVKNKTRKWPVLLSSTEDLPAINKGDFVLDAIFGVGLNRPISGWVEKVVQLINNSGAFVLSIDMPSGLMADEATVGNSIVHASYTITFQAPKLSFFLPQTGGYVGELQILDIGLDKEWLQENPALAQLISKEEARALYKPRNKFSHKGTYGHALIIGGSYGKIGSVCLAARAALKSGAGILTVFIPSCGYEILQTGLPEAMVITDIENKFLTQVEYDFEPSAIGFGVGAGTNEKTVDAMKNLLQKVNGPIVIDADGLNILSRNKDLLLSLPEASILTPHPKELERLMGSWANDFEKLEKAREFCKTYKVILVIKGAYSLILTPQDIYVNSTGNPGMATAGSGDVLTGILTALLSQRYSSLAAAVFGVYIHGKAGDIAAENLSFEGVMAGDISKNIGAAILDLFNRN